jgi:hypothetical protein
VYGVLCGIELYIICVMSQVVLATMRHIYSSMSYYETALPDFVLVSWYVIVNVKSPHTAMYVSAYCYICVLILLHYLISCLSRGT